MAPRSTPWPAEEPRFRVEQERGITHAEFFRVLPRALAGMQFEVSGLRVYVTDGPGRLLIELSEQGERRLSAFVCMPVTRVTMTFFDYTEERMQAFTRRFNQHYLRGGG